jgi:TonB-dependent SusC/RagA subfamily outer membrane receptor
MRTITILTVALLSFSQLILSQNDTLTGVLRDAKNKPVRNHFVTLGSETPVTVKTNRQGVFTIPHANLNDTLYIEIKKDKNEIYIPVKGYNYLTITLTQTAYKADHRLEPSPELQEILRRERNKMIRSSVMSRSEIEKSRCQDVFCLLARLSGVTVVNGSVRLNGGINSINSSSAALIVVNGVPSDESILHTFHIKDIERIEALKEATIYGARGANGAIIITTGK